MTTDNALNLPSPFAGADWIGSLIVGGPCTSAPSPYLRKSFFVTKPVKAAWLKATALGVYECEINGRVVGDQIFAPGWTQYGKRVQYQTRDVTGLLLEGENVLGAVLGDGWYCGNVGWVERQLEGDRPRFLARLDLQYVDGSEERIVTDRSWRTASGPILESDMQNGETYDARLELGGWSRAGYDDAHWVSALHFPSPEIEISVSAGPEVRRVGEISPVKSSTPKANSRVRIFDLGQNFSGWARIAVRGKRGMTLTLRFAEALNPDGTIYTKNLGRARATDRYTCRGEDLEVWEPKFTFHGFRYVEASFWGGEITELTGIVLQSDTPVTGRFACSNPLLNQLQSNIVWGQKSNFLEVPTDCPQRSERLGWTGDAQVFIRTACFNMDVLGFFRKWLLDLRDGQSPEGEVPDIAPTPHRIFRDGGPAWADAVFICPWTLWLCYGEKARPVLEENYESMRRYLLYLEKRKCLGRIRSHPDVDSWGGYGDWLALDGSSTREGATAKDLIGTAFYAYATEITAGTAEILGHAAEAKALRLLHEEIVAAFQKRFVTPEGLVSSGTQTAYILALRFGLIPKERIPVAVTELIRDIEKRGFHLSTGFVGTPHLLEVLEQGGRIDVAYKLLEQETFPSWLVSVKNGATTIWERWDGWTPEKGFHEADGMNSFNHYAYGAVGEWMYKTVAGLDLDPNEPGYRHILFRPHPGGSLTWAEAELETPQGKAAIRWEISGEKLAIELLVPGGSRATFVVPPGWNGKEMALAPGRHQIELVRH